MEIITDMDDQDLADYFCGSVLLTDPSDKEAPEGIERLVQALFPGRAPRRLRKQRPGRSPYPYLLLVKEAPRSNLTIFSEVLRQGALLPHGTVCLAALGHGFLGRHDRSWRLLPGNLHGVVHLRPAIEPGQAGCAFSILAAVALTDLLPAACSPGIKWVNDVEGGGKKVAGLLTRQVFQAPLITDVTLGAGVNVLGDPHLPPNPFVIGSSCLDDLCPRLYPSPGALLFPFLERLHYWYERVLEEGPGPLFARYRELSMVLGREVRVYQDGFGFPEESIEGRRLIAAGRVEEILDDLSLRIRGHPRPVGHGRLAFEEDCPERAV